jgi:hypothetical protein
MQQHLCRTLAHYTIYLATKLGLPIPSNKERFVLQSAHSVWNKEGHFVWTTETEDEIEDEEEEEQPEDALLNDDYSLDEFDRWKFHISHNYPTGKPSNSQIRHDRFSDNFSSASGTLEEFSPTTTLIQYRCTTVRSGRGRDKSRLKYDALV